MQSAEEVVAEDVDSICRRLSTEFGEMAGSNLLITGGAGFLGYYFVHAIHHHNRNASESEQILDQTQSGIPVGI